jgi:hypothetical protein
MYLFATSFHSSLRIYSIPASLDLQEGYDKTLGPAVIKIFLSTVLSNSTLTEKYILSTVHINTWASVQRSVWPFLRLCMSFYYDLSPRSISEAWKVVDQVFSEVEAELLKESGGRAFIAGGNTISAADMSFASHAALVLFPNSQDDTFADNLGLVLPSLKELPAQVQENARRLRATVAGKHALRMYRKERVAPERKDGFRSYPSKFSKENNPWWTQSNGFFLQYGVYAGLVALVLVLVAMIAFLPYQANTLILIACVGYVHINVVGTELEKKLKQVYFVAFGKPVPTERDLAEAKQQQGEKENEDEGDAEEETEQKIKNLENSKEENVLKSSIVQ